MNKLVSHKAQFKRSKYLGRKISVLVIKGSAAICIQVAVFNFQFSFLIHWSIRAFKDRKGQTFPSKKPDLFIYAYKRTCANNCHLTHTWYIDNSTFIEQNKICTHVDLLKQLHDHYITVMMI